MSSLRVGMCAEDTRGEDGGCSQNGSAEALEGTGTGDSDGHPALTQEMMVLHNKDTKAKKTAWRSQPVLQEPFWQQGVTLTQEQSYLYQLPETDLEVVLASDAEHLALLQQQHEVEEQLETLVKEIHHEDFNISNLFISFPVESFNEDSAWCTGSKEVEPLNGI